MARLFLTLVVVLTVLALTSAADKKKKGCKRTIKNMEACLNKGYKSDGCISGDGTLDKKETRKCNRIAKNVKNCDYECKKEESKPEPEKPEPEKPYDLKCTADDYDYVGADIRNFQAKSFEDCAEVCAKEAGCKSFTLRKSDNHCWLKNKDGGEKGPYYNKDFKSMNLHCDRSAVDLSCKKDNTDAVGADMTNFQSKGIEDCAYHCRDTEGCVAIVFYTKANAIAGNNHCWLKNKIGGANGESHHDTIDYLDMKCGA